MPTEIVIPGSPYNLRLYQVTIPSGASASEIFSTQGQVLAGIFMPSAWTAADIGMNVCWSGNIGELIPLYQAAGAVTFNVQASVFVAFPTPNSVLVPFMQLTSVTASTTTGVAQGGDRVLSVLFRKFLD
jgi:hypothetical protein